ncbi:CCA tRNA nucleotidyltransferase [Consotaella aegiceratis]|uniref:CCA tRNA nucleotidyltransferase n=1 Tax=Consotaella aegiceratis TaxID=3097961 RepID=UPI002F42875D
MSDTRLEAEWLKTASLQSLLKALAGEDEEARVVGGAVRNTLLGRSVTDIDVATTTTPEESTSRAQAAGFKVVPTGFEHGTVTVVALDRAYEVTTLRRDVETDGRHARVLFGRDWRADAQRRDFTINALYCDAGGRVFDLVGGIADIEARQVRFIGEAAARIQEDHLRVLRFFRFFAWYGQGRPDAEAIRASARFKSELKRLSAERVWAELRKLLGAPDPSRALLWMRQTGVLTKILPESERWGIDAIHGLCAAEADLGWEADALLRLQAIVPPDPARMSALATRLRLSNAERDRLLAWATAEPIDAEEPAARLRGRLYFGDRPAIRDRLRLAYAAAKAKAAADPGVFGTVAALHGMLKSAETFAPPEFPLSGDDLIRHGIPAGPALGETLNRLRRTWVDSGFVLSRDKLLEKIAADRVSGGT